jgi:DNA topoisomerase I
MLQLTMSIAQELYESGLITYMRTDNPTLSDEALSISRAGVAAAYGNDYVQPTGKGRAVKKPKGSQVRYKNRCADR